MSEPLRRHFWREAFRLYGSVTPKVFPDVLWSGAIAAAACGLVWLGKQYYDISLELRIAPYEYAGAILGLLLVLRSNAGYDRWWEARTLWGGIVNQSRNAAVSALSYGPDDPAWRAAFVRWTAAFGHVCRVSLRGEPVPPEVAGLVGEHGAERIARSPHGPSFVALVLADLLRDACDRHGLDRFAFLRIDRERAALIDHLGGCERILKSPLPLVYSIKVRRFIALFLAILPFALIHALGGFWLVPFVTMLIAYPMMALDRIGVELQNPFARENLSHLPLGQICATIEGNLLGLLELRGEGRG